MDLWSESLRGPSAPLRRLRVTLGCPWLAREASGTTRIGASKHANALEAAKRRNNVRHSGQCPMSKQPGTTLYRRLYNNYIIDISVSLFFIPTHQNGLLFCSVFCSFCCCWFCFFASVFPLLLLVAASSVLGSVFGRIWHVFWG